MRLHNVLRGSASVAALACVAFASTASAQDEDRATVDEIVVTAQKREQSLQDVPIVVTAVGAQLLQDTGVRDIKDLTLLTPGLLVTSTTAENVTTARIRGVGTVGDNPGLESSVGVVIDGIYRPRNGVGFGDLGEMERIEVLKGPQGTLFGKNTSAGVINIITAAPTQTFQAISEATAGNHGQWGASQSVSGPLSDTLAGRLYVAARARDGFNDVISGPTSATRGASDDQNQKFYTARGQLLFTPTGDLDIRVIADYTKRDEDCCLGVGINNNPSQNIIAALTGAKGADFHPFERVAYANRSNSQKITDKGLSAEINWDASEAVKVTAISALRKWTTVNGQDSDFSTADLLYRPDDGRFFVEFKQFSQELRFAGDVGDLNWLVGGFYSKEKLNYGSPLLFGSNLEPYVGLAASGGTNPALVSQLAARPFGLIPAGTGQNDLFHQDSDAWAIFTNNSYKIGNLELTLGLRYTVEDKKLDAAYRNIGGGAACAATLARAPQIAGALGAAATTYIGQICAPFADPGFNSLDTHQSRKEKEWSGTVKAAYRFNPQVMSYVSFARGYKAGGFNLDRARFGPGQPNPDTSFAGEFVDSYEAGLKTTLFNRSLIANLAVFQQDFEDFQLNTFTGISFIVASIPKVRSRGVDADFVWYTPVRGLNFQGGVSYADTQYGKFVPGPGVPVRLPGSRMSFAPMWSGSLAGTYEHDIGDNLVFRSSLAMKYTSPYNTGSDLAPGKRQKELALWNGRVGLGSQDERWTFEIWGQNLTNEDYYQVVYDATLQTGQLNAFLGAPRTVGATVRFRY